MKESQYPKMMKCPKCSERYKRPGALKKHLQAKHGEEESQAALKSREEYLRALGMSAKIRHERAEDYIFMHLRIQP